jgi:hypothetical protein
LKKATCLEVENQNRQRLDELLIKPGVALYYQGKRIRKTVPVSGFALAAKWKRSYRCQTPKEPWYILTNLGSLTGYMEAYKRKEEWALKKCSETVKVGVISFPVA